MTWQFDPALDPEVKNGGEENPDARLAELEAVVGVTLPPILRDFLGAHPCGVHFDSAEFRPVEPSPWDDAGAQSLDCFLEVRFISSAAGFRRGASLAAGAA
jgi:hypothetical protein